MQTENQKTLKKAEDVHKREKKEARVVQGRLKIDHIEIFDPGISMNVQL